MADRKKSSLSTQLRDSIRISGLSLRQLSSRSNVGISVISRFLSGAGISLFTAEKLLEALQRHSNAAQEQSHDH